MIESLAVVKRDLDETLATDSWVHYLSDSLHAPETIDTALGKKPWGTGLTLSGVKYENLLSAEKVYIVADDNVTVSVSQGYDECLNTVILFTTAVIIAIGVVRVQSAKIMEVDYIDDGCISKASQQLHHTVGGVSFLFKISHFSLKEKL